MKIKKTFKLFANCIVVEGISQATICDLHRGDVYVIPLEVAAFLQVCENKNSIVKRDAHSLESEETIAEYIEFFKEKELGFWTDEPESFPDLNMKWSSPEVINNAIVEIENIEKSSLLDIANSLKELLCKFIEIRLYNSINKKNLSYFLSLFNDSTLKGITIFIPYLENDMSFFLKDKILTNPLVSLIVIHGVRNHKLYSHLPKNKVKLLEKRISDTTHCGIIDPNMFSIKIPVFTESMKFNSCLNKKISICENGDIKNCPSMEKSYGNIKDTSLREVINNKEFKKYWNITKDQVAGCKDCEFRRVCTDCRAYLENPSDIFSKPLKCGYSPLTNEWAEWSTNPLKKEAIEYYDFISS